MKKNNVFIEDFSMSCSLGEFDKKNMNLLIEKLSSAEEARQGTPFFVDNKHDQVHCFSVKQNYNNVKKAQFKSRNNEILLATLMRMDDTLASLKKKYSADRIGVIIGTSTSGIDEGISAIEMSLESNKLAEGFDYRIQEMFSPSDFVSDYLSIKGISYSISTACTSGSRALIEGKNLIESGLCDSVIVGGCDTLNELTVHGFYSLDALSKDYVNAFSKGRDGTSLGEGCALFVLTKEKSCIELAGVGESSDGYHPSSPHPEAVGAISAIERALKDADINAEDVDYVNLHGTGTLKNDLVETKSIKKIFGIETPWLSSTKAFHGHCLGAAGSVEAAILCSLILSEKNHLPLHVNDGDFMDEVSDFNFVMQDSHIDSELKYVMSNSFAFGGNNTSLIMKRVKI